jgi:hypothetical protein
MIERLTEVLPAPLRKIVEDAELAEQREAERKRSEEDARRAAGDRERAKATAAAEPILRAARNETKRAARALLIAFKSELETRNRLAAGGADVGQAGIPPFALGQLRGWLGE